MSVTYIPSVQRSFVWPKATFFLFFSSFSAQWRPPAVSGILDRRGNRSQQLLRALKSQTFVEATAAEYTQYEGGWENERSSFLHRWWSLRFKFSSHVHIRSHPYTYTGCTSAVRSWDLTENLFRFQINHSFHQLMNVEHDCMTRCCHVGVLKSVWSLTVFRTVAVEFPSRKP